MASVGELSIKGSIDTTLIERGFSKIKKSFERVKSSSKSFASDMVRIGQATAKAAKSLAIISTVGLTAMIGLAKSAPAVAPAMAKIGVEFQRLSRILGEQLRPFFEKFSESFTKFVSFVDAHPNITKAFALGAGALTGVYALTKMITALSGAISPGMLAALGLAGGIVAAGYVGAKGAQAGTGAVRDFLTTEAEQIPGTWQSLATIPPGEKDRIVAGGYQPTRGGMISAGEQTRKWILLRFWDSLWD